MKTKFIVFSGGCYSGKTTTMHLFKDELAILGIDCVILDELVRKTENFTSIDELRKNPHEYLRLQCDWIGRKIKHTEAAFIENKNKVVLIDRSLTDSLFYLTFYVDKAQLSKAELLTLNDLCVSIDTHLNDFKYVYSNTLFFEPIIYKCDDIVFRPTSIHTTKHTESFMIKVLNNAYCSEYETIDLNEDDVDDVVNRILIKVLKRSV